MSFTMDVVIVENVFGNAFNYIFKNINYGQVSKTTIFRHKIN